MLPMQGAWVQTLVRELDPTGHNLENNPAYLNEDWRFWVLQLRPNTPIHAPPPKKIQVQSLVFCVAVDKLFKFSETQLSKL